MREAVSEDILTDRRAKDLIMVDKAEGSLQMAWEYMTRKLGGWHVKQWTDRKHAFSVWFSWKVIWWCNIFENIINCKLLLYTKWMLAKTDF